jgi:fused signal recognition particle receptor
MHLSAALLAVIAAALVVVVGAVIAVLMRKSPQLPSATTPAAIAETKAPDTTRALASGLAKTRTGLTGRISALLAKKQIDQALLGELEEILFSADIGAKTAAKLFATVQAALPKDRLGDANEVMRVIRETAEAILTAPAQKRGVLDVSRDKPFVILAIGVNGVGKTTTIGKLAAQYASAGKRVLLAAGDTFRAAATEQLEVWGSRANVPVVRGKEGQDPSSVIFDAVKRAQSDGTDIVIADTAGRLHTKTELMDELQKVRRVVQKAMPAAPHETFLVLDATNGQNAIAQATLFKQAMDITGIVLTKLDGTAKGGVILGICDELDVPVRFIGIGEKLEDLRAFDPLAFVAALFATDDFVAEQKAS